MTRRVKLQLFALAGLLATIGYCIGLNVSQAQQISAADRQRAAPSELGGTASGELRLREGMELVNQVGKLREQGGLIAFLPDGSQHPLQLLENLALERVSRDLERQNLDREWSVSGVVTEYKGGNFLLLNRAVLKARPATSPEPRS